MTESNNLLVLTLNYSTFVKNPMDIISKYFDNVYVMARYNPIANISNYFPINSFKPYRKNSLINLSNKPKNLTVFPISLPYLPTDKGYKKSGDQHLKIVNKILTKNKINFNLIHSHFTWTSGYVGQKLKGIYHVPSILTIHENQDWFLKEYNSKFEKIYDTWKFADAIIRVNKIDIPLLEKFNKNVYYIPNGFSDEKFFRIDQKKAKTALGIPIEKKIIFSLGLLIERKGFQFLIDAIKDVIKINDNVLCVIGGHGKLKNYLDKKIKNVFLTEHIKLIDFIPENKLNLWMNSADIFVLPSLSEGTPKVLFEALGCGKPFIGTNVGGTPEIIESEDYGLLCEPANVKDLAQKIIEGLNKKWNYEKIINYSQKFAWRKIVEQIYTVYKKNLI